MEIDSFPVDVIERCIRLGCPVPEEITLLPLNLLETDAVEDFIFPNETKTLLKYFRRESVPVSLLGQGKEIEGFQHTKAADIVLPALFIPLKLLLDNPAVSPVAYNILSSFIWDAVKGFPAGKQIEVDIVCPKDKKGSNRLHFRGTAEAFNASKDTIVEAIRELRHK